MEPFTITELSYGVIAMSGAISGILMVLWKSRCRSINCCWGGVRCDRNVLQEEEAYQPNAIETAL